MDARLSDAQEPIFYLLGGRGGWRTGEGKGAQQGTATSLTGLRLAADSTGPLSLLWPDGSLGGLILPRGMALDGQGALYLLEKAKPWRVLRYAAESKQFIPLPGVGGQGHHRRRFYRPLSLAVGGNYLYVVDSGNRRVQVFDLGNLALRYVWDVPFRRPGRRPLDAAVHGRCAYILAGNRVYCHTAGRDRLASLIRVNKPGWRWRRIAVGREGEIYLLRCLPAAPQNRAVLDVYSPEGAYQRTVNDAAEVRDRFDPPAVRMALLRTVSDASKVRDRSDPPAVRTALDPDHMRAYFCLPESLTRPCDRQLPDEPPAPETPLALCLPPARDGLIFDRNGQRVQPDPTELVETPGYCQHGTWISQPLDSRIYQCQWHRVELDLTQLPSGCRVKVSTHSAASDFSRPYPESPLWQVGYDVSGAMQPPPDDPGVQAGRYDARQEPPDDFLVQSRQGQYLWIKVDLYSDGFATPVLRSLCVHFPRQSYLDYLPAVYASDDESRWFMERFLSVFKTELDVMEKRLEDLALYFDAEAVPAGPFLDELARWLGLPLEKTWSYEQRRNLLRVTRTLYPHRGTLAGLHAYLQAYLQAMTGVAPDAQGDLPLVVEGFRERRRLVLNEAGPGGQDRRMWSQSVVGRLQVGGDLPIGEARLVSTPSSSPDLFQTYGHRFYIYAPADWVRSAQDERMVRRAVEAEKPAHTVYDLCLVEARLRVGVQSTVGVDTLLGCYPRTRLVCAEFEQNLAPSRGLHGRLGYDTLLSGSGSDSMSSALPFRADTIVI